MRTHPVVVVGLVVFGVLFLGSYVFDYAAATPQLTRVTIIEKIYRPGHYEQECSSDDHQRQKCRSVWQSPEWSIKFSGGDEFTVDSDAYDRFRVGDEKWLSYRRGAFWGIRYARSLSDRPPDPESGK